MVFHYSPAKPPPANGRSLIQRFRNGEVQRLIISKVGNFAIDLPDASVMIQISGTFGSRQEEAQRLGRILRPKQDGQLAHFYTLVSKDSQDQEFGANRQLFLTEQGYQYTILYADEVADYANHASNPSSSFLPNECSQLETLTHG